MCHTWSFRAVLIIIILAGAGCMPESGPSRPTPTLSDPINWATANPPTEPPAPTAILLPTATAAPTLTLIPEDSAVVTAAVPAENVPPPDLPTHTPSPSATLMPASATQTPYIPTITTAPTLTSTPMGILSPTLPSAATGILAPPPTFTPAMLPLTPLLTVPSSAQVCPTCANLRLRDAPGTAGTILTMLPANVALTIIGRTEDNQWVQVVTTDNQNGWVAAEYLIVNIDLSVVSVTGTAANAPTAVAMTGSGTAVAMTGPVSIDIVSGISSNARRIFLDGVARGNLPHVFTRVGDSITAAPQFLTPIGQGSYSLGEYGYLANAISFFSGPNGRGQNPFAASSMAARNGWGTTSILDPANADPGLCRAGETPLACEYRVVKPSVALIMIGTNDSGGLPAETYRANLQQIVQISINMGVIPVLSTIPPKHYDPRTDMRADEFNAIIVATARAYDIPLWNYWQAMRNTPGDGLNADGVHPSTPPDGATAIFDANHLSYGYTVRNLTALQVLYELWRQVLYDADQVVVAPAAPPASQGAYSCPGAPPPRLTVGSQGRVTPGLPNKVRSVPATSAEQIGSIPGEGVFMVLDGPRCADGYTWWQVNYNGLIGWTASGTASEYWVEPYP